MKPNKQLLDLKFIVIICHIDSPGKLLTLCFVVNLLNRDVPLLTPLKTMGDKCENYNFLLKKVKKKCTSLMVYQNTCQTPIALSNI